MKKNLQNLQNIQNIQDATIETEKKFRRQKKARQEKKKVAEDLSQQWVAPTILLITLLLGYLVYSIYN